MNSLLYTAIYNSRKRLEPAISKQKRENPLKERVLGFLRILSPLQDIPIRIDKKYTYFLDGKISKNSKTGQVYNELIEAGVVTEAIWHKPLKKLCFFDKLLRVIVRLPKLIVVLYKKNKKLKSLDLVTLQVFTGYVAYKDFFRKHDKLIPIIISDLSPTLHMQWSGAKAANNKVFWWQDDYHHYNGFSTENYFPYPCDRAAILNQQGLETLKDKSPGAEVFKRRPTKVKTIKLISDTFKIGLATNAFFDGNDEQIEILNRIRNNLKAKKIQVRLHPNSKINNYEAYPEWMQFSSKKETLEDYVKSVDLVIVGNSAVQLKLLCLGIPVIHVEGFDAFGYDLYGYCKKGFSFGLDENQTLNLEMVKEFYNQAETSLRLNNYINVLSEIPALDKMPKA